MSEAAIITSLYEAFARKDGPAMAALYAADASFTDPVFPDLRGEDIGHMWCMLTGRAADLVVEFRDVQATGDRGSAHWEATYTFSATGRRVHNVIDATFRFADGKIVEHVDAFDFWRWSRQALGLPGVLLGWSPIVHGKVQRTAAKGLAVYKAKLGS